MHGAEDRNRQIAEHRRQIRRGERAEGVASWYFRLNGCLSIPGFIVHPDEVRSTPITEADLIAVRFSRSTEVIANRVMEDDAILTALTRPSQILFLLVEVKTDVCNINGPWSDRTKAAMQRVVRRIGFAPEPSVESIAETMYDRLRWEDANHVLQYVAVGKRPNDGRQRQYPGLLQITWDDMSDFFFRRFAAFPEKLPSNGRTIHGQWPDFGRFYGQQSRKIASITQSRDLVWDYIDKGTQRK